MKKSFHNLSIKVSGQAGQGVKSVGLIIAKAIKRCGFNVFGYTEYPSLIKGGINTYQINISNKSQVATTDKIDILLAWESKTVINDIARINKNGIIIHDKDNIKIESPYIKKNSIKVYALDLENTSKKITGSNLMQNTVALGSLWKILNLDKKVLKQVVKETYNKSKEMIDNNLKCIDEGYKLIEVDCDFKLKPKNTFKEKLLITGNEAIALSAIASGVRLYSSYPMTPASSILTYISIHGPKKGMIVKQAEDEITSANMAIGASHSGTRSFCATSGGGFDLMTEAVSFAGIAEIPFVCNISQRPGPATGAPTWSAQGDLNLAVYSSHGEFPKIVIAPADAEEAFYLTSKAFNLADKFQTPVLILTDKMLAESLYSLKKFDDKKVVIDRGLINFKDDKKERYEITKNGISYRWFPGDKLKPFISNSDEHKTNSYSTEISEEIKIMMDKRKLKMETIEKSIPKATVYNKEGKDLKIISWGSNKNTILKAIEMLEEQGISCSFMNINYIYPLNKKDIKQYLLNGKRAVIFECNMTGQLHNLIKKETGIDIKYKKLKYDGRPFFVEEVIQEIKNILK